MTIENETEECEANKRKKKVPVEVHKARSEDCCAISESSDESAKS